MATPLRAWAAFAACTLIWGTTWLAIKLGYEGLDALWGASLRFFLASAILLGLVVARRVPWPTSRRDAGVILFVGIALFGFDYGLIYWGEQFIPSGLTAILFATMPLFVGLFGALVLPAERIAWLSLVGVLLGLGGLAVIFQDEVFGGEARLGPMVAIVLSAAAAASASVVMRRWARGMSVLMLNGGAMLIGATGLLFASLLMGERPALPATGGAWASLLYLAVFGSVVSFLLYLWLLKTWTANRASLVALLTPVVAVAAGWLALGERLSLGQTLGALLVLAGVALSVMGDARQRAVAPEGAPTAAAEE